MIVHVRITDATAIENQRVIEQRTVPIRRRFHLRDELGEQRDVERIDLRHAFDFRRIVSVMRQRMMRIGHADFGISAIARLARELERDDARDVALPRENTMLDPAFNVPRDGLFSEVVQEIVKVALAELDGFVSCAS